MSAPRHRRSRRAFVPCIATHIGALLLFALCAPAAGAGEVGETAVAAVQDVLPRLSLPTGTRGLSLEGRIERIEEIIPHLATKEDLRDAKAEMKADLRATETRLEKAIDKNREAIDKSRQATEAKLEKAIRQSQEAIEAIEAKLEAAIANLRAEIADKMRENFLWINGGMAALLSGLMLLILKLVLQLSKEVRQQNGRR